MFFFLLNSVHEFIDVTDEIFHLYYYYSCFTVPLGFRLLNCTLTSSVF